MTGQPVPCLLVIGRDLVFLHKCQDDLQDLPVHGHAQRTVCIGYDIVGPSGVKSGHRIAFPVRPEGELGFVAVAERIVHSDDGFHHPPDQLRIKIPDPHQVVIHFFLLEFQLPFVGHLLNLAAAALTREPAPGLHPVRGRIDDPHQPSVSVILLSLYDFYFHSVTDHSVFNKEGVAVEFSNALAAYTDISDLYDCRIIFLHNTLLLLYF